MRFRSILTLLLFFVFCINLMAQKKFFGVKAGINMPRLYYSNPALNKLPHDFKISPSISIFAEFPLLKGLSIAPEINYQQRGGATSYLYENEYDVTYSVDANYFSLRVPVSYYIPIKTYLLPYLYAGPDVGYAFNGKISLSQPGLGVGESNMDINNSNYNPFYLGVLLGAGIRHDFEFDNIVCIIKLDVALNLGINDTFSRSENEETSNPTNVNAYNPQKGRHSRGMEIHLCLGFIRKDDKSACRSFR